MLIQENKPDEAPPPVEDSAPASHVTSSCGDPETDKKIKNLKKVKWLGCVYNHVRSACIHGYSEKHSFTQTWNRPRSKLDLLYDTFNLYCILFYMALAVRIASAASIPLFRVNCIKIIFFQLFK